MHDHGRDGPFCQCLVGLEPTFTADQQIPLSTSGIFARCDSDRFFEANVLDVADDFIKDPGIAFPRIENINQLQRNHLQITGWVLFAHAALLTRVRSAMPWR